MLNSWWVLQWKSRSLLRCRFHCTKFKPTEQDGTVTSWLIPKLHPHIFPQRDIDWQLEWTQAMELDLDLNPNLHKLCQDYHLWGKKNQAMTCKLKALSHLYKLLLAEHIPKAGHFWELAFQIDGFIDMSHAPESFFSCQWLLHSGIGKLN